MTTRFLNSCEVVLEGYEPGILLHNPAGMGGNKKATKNIPSAEEEAKNGCYWADDGMVAFPSDNIRSGLIRASSGMKIPSNRKMSLNLVVSGDILIEPVMISFGKDTYTILTKRVVIQRQGILRSRPLIYPWELKFTIKWEQQYLGEDFHENILPDLLERLGGTIGIGDYRPEKKGPYGRFAVKSIKKIKASA
jgi:hypothetical protein